MRSLPLGIDIGSTRARIAYAEADRDGCARILAVASRELPDAAESSASENDPEFVAAILEDMIGELGIRERRCVLGVGPPAAAMRVIRFPHMSWAERTRAASFEAARFAGWDLEAEPSVIRVHPVDAKAGRYAVGAVRKATLASRVAVAKCSHLRVVAVDHDAFALRRSLPWCDAILDIGAAQTTLHAFGEHGPLSWVIAVGGAEITRGIARDLSIDVTSAEKRKRILGVAGAGETICVEVVRQIAGVMERARNRLRISRVALTGNGARLPGLAASLETATSASVEMLVPDLLRVEAYPDDV
ncbi:MAG: pilus assembly protein PilM, partial [Candidatus Baltobacteraceae bacterium]